MNKVRRRLFIHAGTHKTGSTSIQLLLRETAKVASDAGAKVIYDYHGGTRTNAATIAHTFIRSELWTATRIIGEQPPSFGSEDVIDYLTQQINGGTHERYLLSAEAFCYMRTRNERKYLSRRLDRLKCEVVPIVYLRDTAAWKASWESQLQKMGRTHVFRIRHPDKFKLLDDWYFDKDSLVEFWRAISPLAIFLDYDQEVAERGSVIPSFLNAVGLPQSLNSDRYFLNTRSASQRRHAENSN